MSIRHKVRAEVEELLKMTVNESSFPKDEEVVIYVVLIPKEEDFTEEEMEVYEHEIDLQDKETIKKFLERATKQVLEGDVKDLKLYCFAYDSEGKIKIVSKEPKEDINELVIERINRMKEDL